MKVIELIIYLKIFYTFKDNLNNQIKIKLQIGFLYLSIINKYNNKQ